MNRKKFIGLVIMMLLSVIGIIWVQIVWISDAVKIQNENFNRAVYSSLQNAANSIESSRRMNFFNNYMLNEPVQGGSPSGNISGYLSVGSFSSSGGNVRIDFSNQTFSGTGDTGVVTSVNKSYALSGDTSIVSDTVNYVVTSNDGKGNVKVLEKGAAVHNDDRSLYIRQNEFLNWVRKRSNEFQNMSDQMISEIYSWEKTLELDEKEVGSALKKSLVLSNIKTPFEFAIIRNGSIQSEDLKKSRQDDFMNSSYMVRLFPDNIVRQDLVVSVVFPERSNYLIGSMILILGGSMLFSLFILATFAFSLYFILRQKKISEMKSDFINNMTHEFKTPIATISLAADTITNPRVIGDEKSVRHFIGMIKKENSRMNKKVETILQIASLDKKEIEFRFENVSLHTVIEHSVETIDIQVQQRNGKINLLLEAENPVILGDTEHLTNLVSNLLDNALKYSPESPEITIRTQNVERGVMFTVEDKGIGMTKAVQSRIFERFYRQSSGNVHDVKGFGLGLNYARAIIDAHKGTVSVSSEPGKGSRFDIFLPFNLEG